ncbi:zinc-dependent alcohol dehydrogenase family protein [Undibacterium umbellatum]|uniref:NAD(P)-dependent alcohol dehydrogenase n=1 Tax=Undibacterium umbellatum TaxID=2762300 RepID=A0ABR6ZHU5_9BURK|nr:NAD(P)-dependent alcohol dehydrogenase [Undibacterium umbellatum]MBC3911263.1 NAD(P)-dependent alcohol dehydrogenase [Undibacterium umbellatum]
MNNSAHTISHTRSFRFNAEGNSLRLHAQTSLPSLGENQVLIQLAAYSLNYRDLLNMQDINGRRADLIPLSDAAGTVVAVGKAVSNWQPGDRVSPNFFPAWHDGVFAPHHLASALGGGQVDGVLAEHVVLDADAIARIPAHLSFAQAACLPCAGVTAWHALFERGQLQAGQTVLVQGTGGVAMMALQLATAHGARVIVTSSSEEKLARARELGAWHTINYRQTPDWDLQAMALTEGRGVDHILELGGAETYQKSISAVAFGGQIAQIGVLTGFNLAPNMLPLQFKNANVNGICVGSVAHLRALNQFMEQHQITPLIDKTFAFEDSAAAFEHLRSAAHMGKVVIQNS